MVEFNSSKKDKDLQALDVLLQGKSDAYKGRILEYVRNAKVDADDPTFVLTVALGNLETMLVDLPQAISAGGAESLEQIRAIITKFQTQSLGSVADIQAKIESIESLAKTLNKNHESLKVQQGTVFKKIDETNTQMEKTRTYFEAASRIMASFENNTDGKLDKLVKKADGLVDKLQAIEQHSIPVWNINNWSVVVVLASILLCIAVGAFKTDGRLSSLLTQSNQINDRLKEVEEKVGYDTVKLGRIEKNLGIKPAK
jgi:hypothetical protein